MIVVIMYITTIVTTIITSRGRQRPRDLWLVSVDVGLVYYVVVCVCVHVTCVCLWLFRCDCVSCCVYVITCLCDVLCIVLLFYKGCETSRLRDVEKRERRVGHRILSVIHMTRMIIRPISLLRSSLLRLLTQHFPGIPYGPGNSNPLT